MRLVEGRRYILRDGRITPPLEFDPSPKINFPFSCQMPPNGHTLTWKADGRFYTNDPSPNDILDEYEADVPRCTLLHDEVSREQWRARVARAMRW